LLPLCYEKLPFILVSFGAVILNVMAKYESGAMESLTSLGVESRLAYSLYGIIFYLWKTLLPVDLSPLYEPTTDFNLSQMIAVTSGVIGMILSVGLFALRHRFPAGLTVWICYLALVVPFLGFAHAGLQLVADRYSYLSCMVWPIVLASFFSPSWRMNRPRSIGSVRSGVSMGVVLVVLFVLGTLTWRQTKRWENSVTLWRHAVSVTPSGIVYYQLGQALAFDNQEDEAVKYLKQAIDVYPRYANPHWVLGMIMAKRGSLEDASKSLRRAVELEPKKIDIHREYAGVLARQGKMDEAVASFHRALELNPADTASLNNLGLTLVRQGKTDEAIRYFTRVIETSPGNLEAHVNMANALLVRGDGDGALRYLYQALEISPDNVELHKHLAMVLSGGGDLKGAESHLLKAVELNPQDAANYSNLAIVFANQGDLGKAALYFEQALGINPNLGQAHLGLARVLAAQGKTDEATSHHQAALRILRTQPAAPDPH
jgi:tetratricopeptide (TPR) repeat protein